MLLSSRKIVPQFLLRLLEALRLFFNELKEKASCIAVVEAGDKSKHAEERVMSCCAGALVDTSCPQCAS